MSISKSIWHFILQKSNQSCTLYEGIPSTNYPKNLYKKSQEFMVQELILTVKRPVDFLYIFSFFVIYKFKKKWLSKISPKIKMPFLLTRQRTHALTKWMESLPYRRSYLSLLIIIIILLEDLSSLQFLIKLQKIPPLNVERVAAQC